MNYLKGSFALSLGLLVISKFSYAGLGERKWHFKSLEIETLDQRKNLFGTTWGCESFSPPLVSFVLYYEIPPSSKPKLARAFADDARKVRERYVGNGVNKITIYDAKSLDFTLPSKGFYRIINVTGTTVEGKNCDTGQTD